MNTTLCIIKPDAVHRQREIRKKISESGFIVVADRFIRLTENQAGHFYQEHRGKSFYLAHIEFMASGPCMPLVLKSDPIEVGLQGDAYLTLSVQEHFRNLVGATDPKKASEDTLRRMFGTDMPRNAVHGSGNAQEALQEIAFFFGAVDLLP